MVESVRLYFALLTTADFPKASQVHDRPERKRCVSLLGQSPCEKDILEVGAGNSPSLEKGRSHSISEQKQGKVREMVRLVWNYVPL